MVTRAPALLAGRYRLRGCLDVSGTSEWWRATDERTGAEVTVELAKPGIPSAEDTARRWEAEADAYRSFRHRALVRVLHAGLDGGIVFAVTAHVGGPTLEDVLAERRLEPEEVRDLALDLCRLFAAARRAGVPHRALVPPRVVVPPAGRIRVAGFLAASGGEPIALEWQPFLAPEQRTSVVRTEAEAVYNVGALLRAACGEPSTAEADPRYRELLGAASKATARDPGSRHRTLAHLATDVHIGMEAERERHRLRPAVALVAVGLALVVLAAWFATPSAVVPSVVGMSPERAAEAVRDAGLLPQAARRLTLSEALVTSQRPAPGTRVRPRSGVSLGW